MNFLQKMFNSGDDHSIASSIIIGSIIISISIVLAANRVSTGAFFGKYLRTANSETKNNQEKIDIIDIRNRAGAASIGGGKVVVTEFSDFQCPFCKNFFEGAYKDIKKKYIDTGKITFIYRHLPLSSIHPQAQKAAEASECALRQGKFFEYHDKLFTNLNAATGSGLDLASLKRYAVELGLNTQSFNQCLDSGATADIVKADIEVATRAGITGTPSFIINGEKLVGARPFSDFESVIEAALK